MTDPTRGLPPANDGNSTHPNPWWERMWVFGSFWIAFAISERLVDRWNPQFRDGDLPPLEWITWLVIWALLTLVPFAILAELVPRAWTHLRERRSTGPA